MSILEIFEALRQVTYAKAQILQQVANSKYASEKFNQSRANEECEHFREILMQKQHQIRSNAEKMKETEMRLIEGLNILKKEEREIRLLKNRRVEERIQLLTKRKQLEIVLEQRKFQKNQINHKRKACTASHYQQVEIQQVVTALQPNSIEIEKEKQRKVQELEVIEKEVEEQRQLVSNIFSAYGKLEESIESKRKEINELKNALQKSEFKNQKLKVQNNKLLKEAYLLNQQHHFRNLENKIQKSGEANRKFTQICQAYLKGTDQYVQTVQRIKKQLQTSN